MTCSCSMLSGGSRPEDRHNPADNGDTQEHVARNRKWARWRWGLTQEELDRVDAEGNRRQSARDSGPDREAAWDADKQQTWHVEHDRGRESKVAELTGGTVVPHHELRHAEDQKTSCDKVAA